MPFVASCPRRCRFPLRSLAAALLVGFPAARNAFAEEAPLSLLEIKAGAEKRLVPSSGQVAAAADPSENAAPGDALKGIAVTIQPGEDGYPGVSLKPDGGKSTWDLSKFGHVEARIANTGRLALSIGLRVDNPGDWKDNPYNTENLILEPGESRTIATVFGHSFGGKPGFPLKPASVSGILIFTDRARNIPKSFRIETLRAAGSPGEKPPGDPASFRLKPENGVLLGGKVTLQPAQISARAGASAIPSDDGTAVRVDFTGPGLDLHGGYVNQAAVIRPLHGCWDLREFHQVALRLKNTGSVPLSVLASLGSPEGFSGTAQLAEPIAPGAAGDLVIPFRSIWTGIKGLTGNPPPDSSNLAKGLSSDAVASIKIFTNRSLGHPVQAYPASFEIIAITAAAPPAVLPDWLGKRPPVPGDWTQTFGEDFNGAAVDLTKWNIYADNHWDKVSHFSKANVIVGGGVARLRYEKRPGRHNDDPAGKETPYATGFLDTYGKWVQRYGYFEARLKVPRAPGLWPAFWLMPDRGLSAGPQWERASTSRGGMEFDIFEHLTRWGPYRYNVAFHWDGYQEGHKQHGSTNIYTPADKDGFITAGLLWLPGEAVTYANGLVTARWTSSRISSVPSDIMFTHVMGGWDNDDLDDSRLPADFTLDYVRAWQRSDLASPADGVKSTRPTPAAPKGKE